MQVPPGKWIDLISGPENPTKPDSFGNGTTLAYWESLRMEQKTVNKDDNWQMKKKIKKRQILKDRDAILDCYTIEFRLKTGGAHEGFSPT